MTIHPAKFAIRNNRTGEVRTYDHDWCGDDYIWVEGNYSCDCNRALFFARAGGEPDPDDRQCGDTLFSVLYADLPDGSRVPIDEDPPCSVRDEGIEAGK